MVRQLRLAERRRRLSFTHACRKHTLMPELWRSASGQWTVERLKVVLDELLEPFIPTLGAACSGAVYAVEPGSLLPGIWNMS